MCSSDLIPKKANARLSPLANARASVVQSAENAPFPYGDDLAFVVLERELPGE